MTAARTFRFGVVAGIRGPASMWAEEASRFEGDGYSAVLVPDTLWTPSPFLVLATAAVRTTTLRLGTWVLASPLRSPGEVVRESRTLQELSGGRFDLGIGAGRPGGERDAEALGLPWGPAGARVARVEATIAAVRNSVDPVPGILLAGSGDRMLGIAGRLADSLALPTPPTADLPTITGLADRVRAVAPDLELALQLTGVGDDIPSWLRERQGLTPESLRGAESATTLSGDVGRDFATLERLREVAGVSYFTVPGELSAQFAPLVAHAAGR